MSDAWPFSPADWARVDNAARAIVNATFMEDDVLRASRFEKLRGVLRKLRSRYGPHPVLSETEADFTDDPAERRALYEEATQLALAGEWITFTIRISFAKLLLDEFRDPDRAYQELRACAPELASHADESDRRQWSELLARCGKPE